MLPRTREQLNYDLFFTLTKQYFCTTWHNAKTRKSHFFTQMSPEFNQSLLDFFNFVDLQLIFTLL